MIIIPAILSRSVIYEMHVGGFTKDPSSGLPIGLRGTYAGVIQQNSLFAGIITAAIITRISV